MREAAGLCVPQISLGERKWHGMIRCPICHQALERAERSWRCAAGHSFDIARQGYVNLLPPDKKHSQNPGDSLLAVQARRRFLAGGVYAPLAERVAALAAELAPRTILDVGCGEGYYLGAVGRACPDARRIGVDISRDAVRYAAGRDKSALWLCASAAGLPLADDSCDLLLCLFAYAFPSEFGRVLKRDGLWIEVVAGEEHLLGLKSVIYPSIRQREKPLRRYEGFELVRSETLEIPFALEDPAQIADLLAMTPHFWRITKEGAARAAALTRLEDRAQMVINCYCKETAHE